MITVIVQFRLPPGTTRDQAAAIFRSTAPHYVGLGGLQRKYYVFGEDGTAGGVYLWETRAQAEAAYGPDWRQRVTEKYGTPPDLRFLDTPVIVDNTRPGEPISEHAAG